MEVASLRINLDQVDGDISSIMSQIKPLFNPDNSNIKILDNVVNSVDLENACKFFGVGTDK